MGGGEGPARERYKTRVIVGVVGDIRNRDLDKEPEAAYYVPLPQLMWGTPALMVRTAGDPGAMAGDIRKVLLSMDSEVPLYAVRTMDDYFALNLGRARFKPCCSVCLPDSRWCLPRSALRSDGASRGPAHT